MLRASDTTQRHRGAPGGDLEGRRGRPRAFGAFASALSRRGARFGYGFVAQACSSATNFGLVVLAGHVLGTRGLGTMFVGFAAYMFLLGALRGLITEPLITSSSADPPRARADAARAAVTLTIIVVLAVAIIMAAVGAAIPRTLGHGLLLFAPWLVPALVQDVGRSILFRDQPGPRAAASDVAWLAAMACTVPFAVHAGSSWAVTASWGVGAAVGSVVVLVLTRWRPVGLRTSYAWWRARAWSLGRWLGMQEVLYSAVSYISVLTLAGVLGARDYGGLRAVQSVFAPLTLLAPALALPGLPLVSRMVGRSPRRALTVVAKLGLALAALTGAYVILLYALRGVLTVLFGPQFATFHSTIIPVGVGQVLLAPTFALILFYKAQQRGRQLFLVTTGYACLYLLLAVALGAEFGLNGAAWGGAAASGAALCTFTALLIPDRRARGSDQGAGARGRGGAEGPSQSAYGAAPSGAGPEG